MSRPPRVISKTGMYHIIFRGINRQDIFEEAKDYKKLLDIIKKVKEEMQFELYAYCLMSNHVHLFLKEKESGDIKKIMHKVLTTYVGWFNFKYERSGSLIGNRYKSEPIEDDAYFLTLIKYIHMNPVKAGITQTPNNYIWSSYNDYFNDNSTLTDTEYVMSLLSEGYGNSTIAFNALHSNTDDIDFSISDTKTLTDEQAKRKIQHVIGIEAYKIAYQPIAYRNQIISKLRNEGFTIRQLVNVTGLQKSIIEKIK